MRILNINNNYNNKPMFKGFERTVYKAGKTAIEENILHRNNTYALRGDINWVNLAKISHEKYKDTDNVSTYFYACSDGREPQSFLIALESMFGKKAVEKFCPIFAIDYDPFVINLAKKNFYEFSEEEVRRINKISGGRFSEYYEPLSKLNNRYRSTNKLTDRIFYQVGDFTKAYENLPKEKVFLSVRNCWPYFSMANQYTLPEKICNHFEKDATIVIGNFDLTTQESIDFMQNGFRLANESNIIFVK